MAKRKAKDEVEGVQAESNSSGKIDLRSFRKAMGDIAEKYTSMIVDIGANQLVKGVFLDSPQLTYLFGGKYPTDRIMQLQGPESSGKSTVSNYIAGQLQKKKPTQPVVLYVDFERTFDPVYAGKLGLDTSPEKFVLIHPDCGEDAFEVIDALLKTGSLCCIILDSDAAMPTRSMTTDEYGKATFGGTARLVSDALKRVNILLNKYETSMIWISQERASMSMYGSPFAACVTPSTLIDIKDIGDIEIGQFIMDNFDIESLDDLSTNTFFELEKDFKIKCYNHKKNKIEYKKVLSVIKKEDDYIYLIQDKDGITILECAGAHGIFDAKETKYVPVADVTEASVLNDKGEIEKVKIVRTETKSSIYDLQVEDNENYFSNGILSHNTGGNSIKFFASIRNRITKVDVIKDGKEEVGIQIKVRNLKNKTSVPWREAIMNLYFEGGFDTEAEYVDFLISLEIIEQRGAYFYVPGEEKGIQGKEKLIDWLNDPAHKELYDKWKIEINEKLSGKLASDVANENPDPEEAPPVRGSAKADIAFLAEQAAVSDIAPPSEPETEEPPELNI